MMTAEKKRCYESAIENRHPQPRGEIGQDHYHAGPQSPDNLQPVSVGVAETFGDSAKVCRGWHDHFVVSRHMY